LTNSAQYLNTALIIHPSLLSFPISTAANGVIGKIHTKMPVILLPEDEDEWLNPDISELERLLPLLKQFPDNTMGAYPMSYTVNIPKSDHRS
jgi:putative SOS response-associated peptidase YedK